MTSPSRSGAWPRIRPSRVVFWGTLLVLLAPGLVAASHIHNALDVDFLRPRMRNEGYLSFSTLTHGEERTGWTDIRHPALDGTVDRQRGYDYSDHQVVVRTHNVNAPNGNTTVTEARRRDDFNVANAAYAQAGISVRQEANGTTNGNDIVNQAGTNPASPAGTMTAEPSLSTLFGTDRSPNAHTVNEYYVDDIPGAVGYAFGPNYAARGGFEYGGNNNNALPPGSPVFNVGFAVADDARRDTFTHELGHVLLDQYRFDAAGEFHSGSADDLMAAGGTRTVPTLAAKDGGTFGLRDPGLMIGNIGTTSHFGQNVTSLAGGAAVTQSQAINLSPFIQRDDNDARYGDRADFDWVEDNLRLEPAAAADNHPGVDFMEWGIGPVFPEAHVFEGADQQFRHDHDGWGSLALDRFNGDSFRTIDIVSQILRYTDMDVDAAGNWSARESALDFTIPEFSDDGVNWLAGTLLNVFIPGWNPDLNVHPDDYVSRWSSPIDAFYVRLKADELDDRGRRIHDANTQIDAIIATSAVVASVPEPLTLVSAGTGALLALASRRRRARAA